jgi:uncharacterized membrane protein YgdD (TMEM256/DUF423 family)
MGVMLGALGAHGGLRDQLEHLGTHENWVTAVQYQLIHAIALLFAALWLKSPHGTTSVRILWAARFWVLGVVLFSGSIFWLSLGGPKAIGPLTPLGGIAHLLGWSLIVIEAWRGKIPSSAK